MKKLFLVAAMSVLTVNANASFFDKLNDKVNKVLTKTSEVLNTATGTSQNQTSGGPVGAFEEAQAKLPTANKYTLPTQETKDYKIENLTLDVKQSFSSTRDADVFVSGEFYNKTNKLLTVKVIVPVYDSEGFSQSDLNISITADANQKVRIRNMKKLYHADHQIAIQQIKYLNCYEVNQFGVC